jgi:hypothetical protein
VKVSTFHMSKVFGLFVYWWEQVAIDLCPVNCIHYVEREDLSILEYLIRFQQKQSNGVFGGTWERPRNVFMAARTFKRQMEEKKIRATESGKIVLAIALSFISCMKMGTDMATT